MRKIYLRIKNRLKHIFIDLDISKDSTILISGMGRSGTTWLSELLNYNHSFRDVFEPFLPYKVEEAKNFKYLQYLDPSNNNTDLARSAKNILSGRLRSTWTDVNISKLIYTKRIVKDIRINLMLAWLKNIRPTMPIILILRSPYSVIESYKELGWGTEAGGKTSDYDRIISQNKILRNHPFLTKIIKSIDKDDHISKLAFQWCIFYYIPIKELSEKDYLLIHYEHLLLEPETALKKILNYINYNIEKDKLLDLLDKPSNTNYRKTNFNKDKNQLIEKWKISLTKNEISKINKMIDKFDMNYLYNSDGYPSL